MGSCVGIDIGKQALLWKVISLFQMVWRAVAASPMQADAQSTNAVGREAINRKAERILGSYGDSILRLAYSYLHNRSDAEEVLQDTLVQFLKTAPSLETDAHEKAWLLRVASNLSKNRIGYNRVRRVDELDEQLAAEECEDLSFVWEAVRMLPVKYREVIHLFYCEGYPAAQVADILHEKQATVRSRLKRGREKLKEILKEAYDFE